MLEYDRWNKMRDVLGWVAKMWDQPDRGIWEIRGEPRHFLHSKLMCWVAADRGARLADRVGESDSAGEWQQVADKIRENGASKVYAACSIALRVSPSKLRLSTTARPVFTQPAIIL